MFTVKRFNDSGAATAADARTGADGGPGAAAAAAAASKLAALNARIAARRKQNEQQSQKEQQQQPPPPPPGTAAPPDAASVPAIHPSRLRIAPALRAKDTTKPKTKAKQRYLKAKKERRKSRVKARPKGEKAKASTSAAATDTLAATVTSAEEEAAIAQAWGQRKRAAQSEADDADSDSDSDDDDSSTADSDSDDSDADDDASAVEEPATIDADTLQPALETEPAEPGVLHRFPAPRSTLLPASSAILRAQGLPSGLSAPTVISPALRASLGAEKAAAHTARGGVDDADEDTEMADAAEGLERGAKRRKTDSGSRIATDDVISPLISDQMRERLQQLGIKEWFAVQTSVIPLLLPHPRPESPLYPFGRPSQVPRDLLVAAPTGSGKTLAYIVPLLEWLGRRPAPAPKAPVDPILAAFTKSTGPKFRCLRALIVLPTRDLVNQVGETVQLLAKDLDVSVGLAGVSGGGGSLFSNSGGGSGMASTSAGAATFALEQERLVDLPPLKDRERGIFAQDSTDWWSSLLSSPSDEQNSSSPSAHAAKSIQSKVDILITTPGRLVDHLTYTPGFTLEHLRWLIMDEADRLLAQSFGGWREKVWEALRPRAGLAPTTTVRAPAWQHAEAVASNPAAPASLFTDERPHLAEASHVQKVLFSATLTRDPGMLEALELRRPLFVTVRDKAMPADGEASGEDVALDDGSFALPEQLKEHVFITKDIPKPLALLHLLLSARFDMLSLQPAVNAVQAAAKAPTKRKSSAATLAQDDAPDSTARGVLVFTKSVEAAWRLVRLLELFREEHGAREVKRLVVRHYSSEMRVSERRKVLQAFTAGDINVLVASDLIARGIDLPSVSHVISYDVPIDMGKYVHRVGRTARAGRRGDAWVLVEQHEARHFRTMVEASRGKREANRKMEKVKVVKEAWSGLEPAYRAALSRLATEFSNRS